MRCQTHCPSQRKTFQCDGCDGPSWVWSGGRLHSNRSEKTSVSAIARVGVFAEARRGAASSTVAGKCHNGPPMWPNPSTSTACTAITCFAKSRPTVVILSMTSPLNRLMVTLQSWHSDAEPSRGSPFHSVNTDAHRRGVAPWWSPVTLCRLGIAQGDRRW
jgi:hypothetical protein